MALWMMALLVALGLAAIVVEMFVPAGGVVGVLGGIMMIAGIVLTYVHHGVGAGSAFLIVCIILVPMVLVLGFRLFPHTYVGKRLIMNEQLATEAGYQSSDPELVELEGKEGEAITTLRPSGMGSQTARCSRRARTSASSAWKARASSSSECDHIASIDKRISLTVSGL